MNTFVQNDKTNRCHRKSLALKLSVSALCAFFGAVTGLALVLGVLPLPAFASDTEYVFTWKRGDTSIFEIDEQAGIPNRLTVRYDISSEVLDFELNILPPTSNPSNYIAKGFNLIVSGGEYPHFGGGEFAVLYFDATVPSQPKLTAYPYNAYVDFNDSLSYEDAFPKILGIQQPDRICTSLNSASCGGWIHSLSVVDEADGSRTFSFEANMAHINDLQPTWANGAGLPWQGAGFQGSIGVYMMLFGHPTTTFTYRSDGYIDQLLIPVGADHLGAINTCLHPPAAQREPYCVAGQNSFSASAGVPVSATFGLVNPDGRSVTVTYSGVPSDATVSPASGTTVPATGTYSTVSGSFSWTPQISNAGSTFTVTPTFLDSAGFSASCPFSLVVAPNNPQCSDTDITGDLLALDSNAKAQSQVVKRLTSRYASLAKGTSQQKEANRYRRTTNSKANDIFNASWTVLWSEIPQVVTSCVNSSFCVTTSHASALASVDANTQLLYQLAVDTEEKIRGIGGGAKKLLNKATTLRDTGLQSSSLVPKSTTSCP